MTLFLIFYAVSGVIGGFGALLFHVFIEREDVTVESMIVAVFVLITGYIGLASVVFVLIGHFFTVPSHFVVIKAETIRNLFKRGDKDASNN